MAVAIPQVLQGLTRALTGLTVQSGLLNTAMLGVAKVANNLTQSIADYSRMQDSALAQNAIYGSNLLSNTAALNDATGGFKAAAQATIELAKIGLPLASKNIVDLGSRMKLSKENMTDFMNVMETALGPGNLTKEALDSLAGNVRDGAISSRISNEKVIQAIGKLDSTLMMQAAFFGGGEAAAKFAATLTTSVEPSMTKAAGEFAKMIMSGGVDFNALQRLGIEESIDSMMHGSIMSSAQVRDMIDTAAMNFNAQVGDASNLTRREFAAIAKGPFGQIGLMAQALSESAKEQAAAGVNTSDGLTKTIDYVSVQLMKGYENMISGLSGAFRFFVTGVKAAFAAISLVIAPFTPIIKGLLYIAGLLIPIVTLIGAVFAVVKLAGIIWTIGTALFGAVLGPFAVIIAALVGIAEFFGYGPSSLIDSITGLFQAQEREKEQESLLEAQDRASTNMLQDFYNLSMGTRSPDRVLLERVAQYLEAIKNNTAPGMPPLSGGTPVGPAGGF